MDFMKRIGKYSDLYENENRRYQNLLAATLELCKREIYNIKCLY